MNHLRIRYTTHTTHKEKKRKKRNIAAKKLFLELSETKKVQYTIHQVQLAYYKSTTTMCSHLKAIWLEVG